jgi:glycerophosphoryl diester phosphodiesterase
MPAYKPLLRDVFSAVDAHAIAHALPLPAYSIELKSRPGWDGLYHSVPAEYLAHVVAVINESSMASRVTLLSFDHRILQAARLHKPTVDMPLCLLVEDEQPLAEHLQLLGFQPDFLGPDYLLLTAELLHHCTSLSLPIITWTVNDAAEMLRLAQAGVYGITTDYPDRAARVFGL